MRNERDGGGEKVERERRGERRKREKGDTVRILILHLIFHRFIVVSVLFQCCFSVVSVLFCSLKKALTLTIPMLCFVLIKYRVFV